MMRQLYYALNELIKSYHVFCKFDMTRAANILKQINDIRLQIVLLAEQREIFIEQLEVLANASGYKNDVFFTHDDIDSLVIKMIAFLERTVKVSLVQEGTRENIFTRQPVAWQQLMSDVQSGSAVGQQIPFDFPQEIYLQKSETLDIGVINQQTDGNIFVHGANLKDDASPNVAALTKEITGLNFDGHPTLPQPVLVPIQFQFNANTVDAPAVAVDGGDQIYSIKGERSVILTEVSITDTNCRLSLIDKGRDQTICDTVEAQGIAAIDTNSFTSHYPLPYPHILRTKDRIQLKGFNGSIITGDEVDANTIVTLCFRGFTV